MRENFSELGGMLDRVIRVVCGTKAPFPESAARLVVEAELTCRGREKMEGDPLVTAVVESVTEKSNRHQKKFLRGGSVIRSMARPDCGGGAGVSP